MPNRYHLFTELYWMVRILYRTPEEIKTMKIPLKLQTIDNTIPLQLIVVGFHVIDTLLRKKKNIQRPKSREFQFLMRMES